LSWLTLTATRSLSTSTSSCEPRCPLREEVQIEDEEVIPLQELDEACQLTDPEARALAQVKALAAAWKHYNQHPSALLRGALLVEARRQKSQLSSDERRFVYQSEKALQALQVPKRHQRLLATAVVAAVLILVAAIGFFKLQARQVRGEIAEVRLEIAARRQEVANRKKARRTSIDLATALAQTDPLVRVLAVAELSAELEPEGGRAALGALPGGEIPSALLRGHTDAVTSLAFNPAKSDRLATLAADGTLLLWTTHGRRAPEPLLDDATTFAWNPDARTGHPDLATGSSDGKVRLWNSSTREVEKVLQGHNDEVVALDWSHDGEWLLSAGRDTTARLWPVRSQGGRDKREGIVFADDESEILQATFNPPHTRVLTVSRDGVARLWYAFFRPGNRIEWSRDGRRLLISQFSYNRDTKRDTSQSAELWNADGSEPVLSVVVGGAALSGDGRRVAIFKTNSFKAHIQFVDGSDTVIELPSLSVTPVQKAAFTADDRYLVVLAGSTVLVLRSDGTGEPRSLSEYGEREFWSNDMSIGPRGRRVLTVENHYQHVWRLDNDDPPLQIPLTEHIAWSGDERWIAAWGSDGAQLISTSGHGEPRRLLSGHVKNVAWSPDGRHVLTVTREEIRIWPVSGPGQPVVLRPQKDWMKDAVWHPNSRFVIAVEANAARLWRVDGSGRPDQVSSGHSIDRLVFRRDGARFLIAYGGGRTEVRRFDDPTTEGFPLPRHGDIRGGFFSPSSNLLATVSSLKVDLGSRLVPGEPRVSLWSTTGAVEFRLDDKAINSAAWDPEGERVATLAEDGSVHVWAVSDGGSPRLVSGGEESGKASFGPLWSADGSTVVTGLDNGTVLLHAVPEATASRATSAPRRLAGHRQAVTSATWSADDRFLLTSSRDGTTRLWDIFSSAEPRLFAGHAKAVTSAAWSPDGKIVATASADRSIRVWPLKLRRPGHLDPNSSPSWAASLRAVHELSSACLTPHERVAWFGEEAQLSRAGYEACEESHGRQPLPDKVLSLEGQP
jgi:WD40 repeat protein